MTTAPRPELNQIYGYAAKIYHDRGWRGILALPYRKKTFPEPGYTGYDGTDPDIETMNRWVNENPYGNICLRMPENVIGIDVDSYDGRMGAQTIARIEGELQCPLPPTWISTSREDGSGSGIRLYRVPSGIHFISDLGKGSNVEILRRAHRYAVVWPSIHEDTGATYRWYQQTPFNWVTQMWPPSPNDLAELPQAWVDYLTHKQVPNERPPASAGHGLGQEQQANGDPLLTERNFTFDQAIEFCRGHIDTLAAAREGGRNIALNDAAKVLSHFIPVFWSWEDAERWLYSALDPNYPRDEANATIASAFKSKNGNWKATLVPDPPPAWQPNMQALEPTRVSQAHYSAPLECLPPLMYQFVKSTVAHAQIVPEMALLAALCSVSYVTGGNVLVDINGYQEPVALYVVLTAEPSERKSGALRAAAKGPLKDAVEAFWAEIGEEQAQIRDLLGVAENKHTKLKEAMAAGKVIEGGEEELSDNRRVIADLRSKKIVKPIWSVTDSTTEGLETAMVETDGAIASFADEAALLSTIAGRYSKGRGISLGSLNQAWSNETIFVLRQSQRRQIDRPFVVLCQFIQPGPFAEIMAALQREEDGFLSRWLFCDPAMYGPRTSYTVPPDHHTRTQWVWILTALLSRFWGQKQQTTLTLSTDAWTVYHEIFAQVDVDQRSYNQVNRDFTRWLGKGVNGHIIRVAALFQLIMDTQATQISGEAMRRAVHLYWWLRAEALKAMHATTGETMRPEVEQEVLGWIAKRRAKDREAGKTAFEDIEARHLKRGPRRFRNMPPAEVEAVLAQLEEQRWLERCEVGHGRTVWKVRPDFDTKWGVA